MRERERALGPSDVLGSDILERNGPVHCETRKYWETVSCLVVMLLL